MSTKVAHKVTVDVPVKDAYAVWTQFERLPTFMKAVDKVEQLDRRHLRWHVDVGGREIGLVYRNDRGCLRLGWARLVHHGRAAGAMEPGAAHG